MPSFRSICLFAITAFAAFASASPVAGGVDHLAARSTDVVARAADANANDLVARAPVLDVRGGGQSVPEIIDTCYQNVLDIQVQVNVLINAGGVISVDDCTPFLTDINNVLQVALDAVQGLVGETEEVIWGSAIVLLGITSCVTALANLLICIVTILLAIIAAVGASLASQIVAIVTATI
ncbi:hypothetical protein H0H92_011055, partial [Tricholoma furcatifolium]